jgi:hypothetical protein
MGQPNIVAGVCGHLTIPAFLNLRNTVLTRKAPLGALSALSDEARRHSALLLDRARSLPRPRRVEPSDDRHGDGSE